MIKKIYDNPHKRISGEYKVVLRTFRDFFFYPPVKIEYHPQEYKLKWENSGGFIAANLNISGVDEFEQELLNSANNWFQSHLDIGALPNIEEKGEFSYDIRNKKNLMMLLSAKDRKKYFTKDQEKIIRKAFGGGTLNAQGQPYLGWRFSGFGIWAHLRGFSFILTKALPEILQQYYKFFPHTLKNNSIPHLIYKPPSRDKKHGLLVSHFDDGSCSDMYQRCLNCLTMSEWVDSYGVQTLAHLKGGLNGGQTNILGPMDTHTYLILLQMIHPKTIHPEMPKPSGKESENWNKWWIEGGGGGPVFYDWYNPKILKIINRVMKFVKNKPGNSTPKNKQDAIWIQLLIENGYYDQILDRASMSPFQPLGKINMLPSVKKSPYLIIWLKGFIHGSNPTGSEPRLTLTITYDPTGNRDKATRALNRLRNLANKNLEEVLKDTVPYEGGGAHKKPGKTEVDLYKFFGDMYITPEDIPLIEEYFLEYKDYK